MPTTIETAKAVARPVWDPPVARRLAAMIAPETPVPIAVPRVSDRLSALEAGALGARHRLAQDDERERRVGEAHPEAGHRERRHGQRHRDLGDRTA